VNIPKMIEITEIWEYWFLVRQACIHMSICIHVHEHIFVYINIHIYIYIHTLGPIREGSLYKYIQRLYEHWYVHICLWVYAYIHIYVYIYIHIYTHLGSLLGGEACNSHIWVYVYTYTYIYIHTHLGSLLGGVACNLRKLSEFLISVKKCPFIERIKSKKPSRLLSPIYKYL
jgi:hypothetical protein